MIDTVSGAKASAIAFSIVETAKANNLNVYQYFKYLHRNPEAHELKKSQ